MHTRCRSNGTAGRRWMDVVAESRFPRRVSRARRDGTTCSSSVGPAPSVDTSRGISRLCRSRTCVGRRRRAAGVEYSTRRLARSPSRRSTASSRPRGVSRRTSSSCTPPARSPTRRFEISPHERRASSSRPNARRWTRARRRTRLARFSVRRSPARSGRWVKRRTRARMKCWTDTRARR